MERGLCQQNIEGIIGDPIIKYRRIEQAEAYELYVKGGESGKDAEK
jgi:hypothetical protein